MIQEARFPLWAASLAPIKIPVLVIRGQATPRCNVPNALLSKCIGAAALATISDAAYFMIATHADEVGCLIAQHVRESTKSRSDESATSRHLKSLERGGVPCPCAP
jgi:pimeloyl-ACP methyl ester carboxylesterase